MQNFASPGLWLYSASSFVFTWTLSSQPCSGPTSFTEYLVPQRRSDVGKYAGNEACAGCHASIYQSYMRTPMARASGPAIENVIPADFVHPNQACTTASIPRQSCLAGLRPARDPAVRGKRELFYYIGSGRRGLSYLFARDGFLFESPVNWYSREQRWDMAPAYQDARNPSQSACLHQLPALPCQWHAPAAEGNG